MFTRIRFAACAAIALSFSCVSEARTVHFSFVGDTAYRYDDFFGQLTLNPKGTGYFSAPDGLDDIGLSDLSDFRFESSFNLSNVILDDILGGLKLPFLGQFGLDDLVDFHADFADGKLTHLELATGSVEFFDSIGSFYTQSFTVNNLDPGGAIARLESPQLDPRFFGKVVIQGAVPEPAAWAMMIAGFGLVGSALRRRAKPTALAHA